MNDPDRIALVDMDGTLCDFEGGMRRDLKRLASPGEPDVENFHDGEPHIMARMKMIKEQTGWWRDLEPMPQNFKVVNEAIDLGYNIHICTKGPRDTDTAWTEKKQWCKQYLPNTPHTVHITENKGVIYGKLLFDDWPPYIEQWLKWRKRGLVIMPAYEYNAYFTHPNVVRYDGTNLDEVVEAMKKRLEA